MSQSFFDSNVCKSRKHCATCRKQNVGRHWRELIGRVYDTPGVDFECPFGLPWVSDNPTAAEEAQFENLEPENVPTPTVDIKNVDVDKRKAAEVGKLLRHHAYAIKSVLPPDSVLVEQLNRAEIAARGGGCKGCRAKRFHRNIAKAFIAESEEHKKLVNEVVSESIGA